VDLRDRVESAGVGRLATVGADGRPHAVPVCFVVLGDVVYSAVDHKPKTSRRLRRVANFEATGHAALLVDHYEDEWDRLWWVRLDGSGRVVTDAVERERAIRALRAKYPQYAEESPAGPVLAIDVSRWSGWSAAGAEP
jgi:PPOX class probable F420-dependent enzyme